MTAVPSSPDSPAIRVLVLDDDASVRSVFSTMLESRGWRVITAQTGREALRLLLQESVDVVVADLRMTEMSGIAFIREALKIWPWLGMVIASGYLTPDVLQRASDLGVSRVLHKPVSMDTLCDSVAGAFEDKRRHPDAPALLRTCADLRRLTQLGVRIIGARTESLADAVHDIVTGLAEPLRCDVVGILLTGDGDNVLRFELRAGVHDSFLDRLQDGMLEHYHSLTGIVLDPAVLARRITGREPSAAGPGAPESQIFVPLVLEQEIRGLFTLAASEPQQYTEDDVAIMYHGAHHLSEVFLVLSRTRRLINRDPLTDTLNRIGLEEQLERCWHMSVRYGYSMGVIVIDIDRFKILNDSYGHAVGDTILREFAAVIGRVSRASDIIARYGGDEFVVILPRASDPEARRFGERFLERVRQHVFCEKSERLRLTASVGIATSHNESSPATSSAVLSQADRALYTAKRAGGNRPCLWPPVGTAGGGPAGGAETAGKPGAQERRTRIAVVDDEPEMTRLLRLILTREGYEVAAFSSADEAARTLKNSAPGRFQLLITDLSLPGMSGIELLRELGPDDTLQKIVMTGFATVDNALASLREGAYDFIQKPFESMELVALVRRALEHRELRLSNARYQTHLEEMVHDRSMQVAASLQQLKISYEYTLEALVGMLDAREHFTGQHDIRVREQTVVLARRMGFAGDDLETVARAALLHDIGKIGIPDTILLKEGSLSAEEWDIMKRHPEIGFNILRPSPYLRETAEVVRCHHERYDGKGYPRGLAADAIPLGARVFAVVDAYDAMRSERPYHGAMSAEEAVREIVSNSGKQFDPAVVECFLECRREMEELVRRAAD